jgi:hypothetical protein
MRYMRWLDQTAPKIYGVHYFHKARAKVKNAVSPNSAAAYYLRTVQEYYIYF